ncbi:MAG: acetate--CoA ligase [Verrucomicrobiota bacterium]
MPPKDKQVGITSVSTENRVFKPSPEFSKNAHVKSLANYRTLYNQSIRSPETFWAKQARNELVWFKPWKKVLQWKAPFAKWFVGGQLNVSTNCLDKWLGTPTANKAALIWEGEPAAPGKVGEERTLTYKQLHHEVCLFANVLKRNGIKKGDRVIIYLPMIPEAAIAMLACTRIGAIHSVVFGGFSAQSVADRVFDSQAKLVITSDGGFRRGAIVPLKKNVDDGLALKDAQGNSLSRTIEKVIVVRRSGNDVIMQAGRDVWWHEEIAQVTADCPAEKMDSEAPLFILYTSGSTGKPKGILHTTGGYLLGAKMTSKYVFDLRDEDVYWCTADIGWVTGHSYVVYGPLANGATSLMYEGAPNFPEPDRFWRIIAKYGVTILYTAPTAIRAFMKWGVEWPKKHDLSSLRLLGSVGEPINPEAWMWYHEHIGGKRCPIVDTWWQTETGGIMITPLPGATPTKPGSATLPFFGILPEVVDDQGKAVPRNSGGKLVIRKPWPFMLRGLWGDVERYKEVYWSEVQGSYFTGDGCRQDKDGYFWIVGRIDDVLNVAGHRIGTAEVESAIVSNPKVAEAAVVGRPDDLKGQALVAFVTLKTGVLATPELREQIRQHVGKEIGPVAKPDDIRFTEALPKTRSGKIMRRLLKQIASGAEIKGDTTTLEDLSVLAKLSQNSD